MSALLEVENLKQYFTTPHGMLHAVDGVSFTLEAGKTLGVVGESGCGKSTLGRTILHLLDRIHSLMDTVGLSDEMAGKYPHEMDGGRRQRIGIARSLALNPDFIVCDEPVSALDVSIQAQILNLMKDLQDERKLAYLFITHDLSVVKHISDDICVMYLGTLVEKSPSSALFVKQYHPYTQALLSAIPQPKLVKKKRILLKGEITSPINPGAGCRFAPRCPYCTKRCLEETPKLTEVEKNHFVACHKAVE